MFGWGSSAGISETGVGQMSSAWQESSEPQEVNLVAQGGVSFAAGSSARGGGGSAIGGGFPLALVSVDARSGVVRARAVVDDEGDGVRDKQ